MTTSGSFRDPDGHVFRHGGVLYRRVEPSYSADYEQLVESGLLAELTEAGLLVDHDEVDPAAVEQAGAYRILRPREISFVSHPYEWCFSQLRDAALLTLEIERRSLAHGMTLKDASAFNVQFAGSAAVFIDTLSFETYEEGRPWAAYGQFCRHFVAPLAMMALRDVRLGQMLRTHIDGVPLDLAVDLLPWHARLRPALWPPLFLHARAERSYADRAEEVGRQRSRKMSRMGRLGLLDNLKSAVSGLKWKASGTEWGDYYSDTNYNDAARASKERLVREALESVGPARVWDLGANTGEFSRLATEKGIDAVAFDLDPAAVEANYLRSREGGETHMLPLLLDLANPSPALGWAHEERASLLSRGPTDLVLALALVHHLAIGNNLPLGHIASFFAKLTRHLLIEFVPKEDSQVQRLLAAREDIFDDYHQSGFEAAFAEFFDIVDREPVEDSRRTLYLLRAKSR